MLVECITEDFSDPEAVSGSSTTFEVKIAYLGIFSCFARLETHSQEENTYLDNFLLQMKTPIWTILSANWKEVRSKEESTNLADSICELGFAHLGVFILFGLVKREAVELLFRKKWRFDNCE